MEKIKITEAWENREKIIEMYKEKNLKEFDLYAVGKNSIINIDNKIDFENYLLSLFTIYVKRGILEEWLPEKLPNATVISIDHLEFSKLPDMPKLKTLYSCKNIKTIQGFPNLETIKVDFCNNLKSIKDVPKLKYLDCFNSGMLEIKNTSNLEYLNCGKCKDIKQISNFPNLEKLNCEDSIGIKEISGHENLKAIYCRGCKNLKTIRDLPSLKYVWAWDCENLKIEDEIYLNKNIVIYTEKPRIKNPYMKIPIKCSTCGYFTEHKKHKGGGICSKDGRYTKENNDCDILEVYFERLNKIINTNTNN